MSDQDFQTLVEFVNDSNNEPTKEEINQMFVELEKLIAMEKGA